MSFFTSRLFAAALFAVPLAHSAPPAPDDEQLFTDDFAGTHVNERDWNFRTGPLTGTEVAEPQLDHPE